MTRPGVFLDRDGTLVEEVPYLHDPERLVLLPGVGELAALAAAALHRRLRRLLAGAGVRLDAVLYCPHHPEGTVAAYARTCRTASRDRGCWRRPPGGWAWTWRRRS